MTIEFKIHSQNGIVTEESQEKQFWCFVLIWRTFAEGM